MGNRFRCLLLTRQIKVIFCLLFIFCYGKSFFAKISRFELHKVDRLGASMSQYVSLVDYLVLFNFSENLIFLVLLLDFLLMAEEKL